MSFRTQIPTQKKEAGSQIDYNAKLMLFGSCFSENIGGKFNYYKFQSVINPFGILFHPKAIETFLSRVVNQELYTESELVFQNERYHCLDAHSSMSNPDKAELLKGLNKILKSTKEQLSKLTHLIITLGTAWVYRFNDTNKLVANCHKIPQRQFKKELLSVNEVKQSLEMINTLIQSVNPNLQIIYTVSPVRHIKDGFVQNQQSKAHLLSAVHQVLTAGRISYFPSYEIIMDELRDYRFYKEDMVHPNQVAVNYIWERFVDTWIAKKSFTIMKEVEVVQKGLAHKPFNPNSEQYKKFLKTLEKKKEALQQKLPCIQF